MKKCYKVFLSFLLFSFVYCFISSIQVGAVSYDKKIYGDGTDITWSLLSSSLPSPYNKTQNITINYNGSQKIIFFNFEMYMDKGLLVYGDALSASQVGYNNDFKAVSNGYFCTGEGNSSVRGEYRYLGLNINGMVQTNSSFPSDVASFTINDLRLIKYSMLPDNMKSNYAVPIDGNRIFEPVKTLINDENSPSWNFINQSNFSTIKGMFDNSGLSNGIFDYGIVNSWGAGGGSIRLFFYHPNDPSIYRYATYVGAVNPQWQKVFPGMQCSLTFDRNGDIPVYTIEPWEQDIQVLAFTNTKFNDINNTLTGTQHDLTWHRHDNPTYKLFFNDLEIVNKSIIESPDKVLICPFAGDMILTYKRSELSSGLNYVKVKSEGRVMLGSLVFNASSEKTICINVKSMRQPIPPVAIISSEGIVTKGQIISFSAKDSITTEPGAYIKDYEWIIDGLTYKGETISTIFTNIGSKMVELKVTDSNNLTDTKTKFIIVIDVSSHNIKELNIIKINGGWADFFRNGNIISTRDMPVFSGIDNIKIPIGSKVDFSFKIEGLVEQNDNIIVEAYLNDFKNEKLYELKLNKIDNYFDNAWNFSVMINRQQLPTDVDNEALICLKIQYVSHDGFKSEFLYKNDADWGKGNGSAYGKNKPLGNNYSGQTFWYDCSQVFNYNVKMKRTW